MPTANIYSSDKEFQDSLMELAPLLKELLAAELSCGERTLMSSEISVRLHTVGGVAMIAPIEIEVTAHAYADRVQRADKICLVIREFVSKQIPLSKDVRVWLILAELGHSWDE